MTRLFALFSQLMLSQMEDSFEEIDENTSLVYN